MDNILEVKKLKISFRTNNGTVKAVRDISFDLKRGETLAIVGESGSGKSVTSKAILGILAGNSIIDGGEILFDGKDLLRISEDEMYKIRGDKISMIFQDPLSSLNPIVKVGKQMTEGMILKNKDNRKNAKKEFNSRLSLLKEHIVKEIGESRQEEVYSKCKTFDDFNIQSIKLQNSFNSSQTALIECTGIISDALFRVERKRKIDVKGYLSDILAKSKKINDLFLTRNHTEDLKGCIDSLVALKSKFKAGEQDGTEELVNALTTYKNLLERLDAHTKPDFFRIGYYIYRNPEVNPIEKPMGEMNEMTLEYLNNEFMIDFLGLVEEGLKSVYRETNEAKKVALKSIDEFKKFISSGNFEKKEALNTLSLLSKDIDASINRISIVKDSVAYTFAQTVKSNIIDYYKNIKSNESEEKRYSRQQAQYDKLVQKGKTPEWKVVPKKYVDPQGQIDSILSTCDRLIERYNEYVSEYESLDYKQLSLDLIDFFKEKASQAVYKVTLGLAKEKAIKLLEEVGIPEPRIRYNQYPFELSGGMRQRIVIAIALSADPDILICDEPTTALDVTIQSQILELINDLKHNRNLSVIFITHDLGVVANMADRVAVMYAGKIVEYGLSNEIFYSPAHPYTWALLSSMPDLETKEKLEAIPGTPPNMIYPPEGDAFAVRNKYALKIDFEEQPPLFKITDTHYAATWLLHPNAPKVEMPKIIKERIERMKRNGGK